MAEFQTPEFRTPEFRTIDELAALVGAYCWVEHRLFELTGAWASEPGDTDPEIRVFFANSSRHHGDLAVRWRTHLPVRAGVDPDALVVEPDGPVAEQLARVAQETIPARRLGGTAALVLSRLDHSYRRHLVTASPVSEAPVIAVLGPALVALQAESRAGLELLERIPGAAQEAEYRIVTFEEAEHPLEETAGIFPGARAS